MIKSSRRQRLINEKISSDKIYSLSDAFSLLRELSSVKFIETVEIAVNLGVDARKSDQQVRGATTLPSGIGKFVSVAVFANGDNLDVAKSAGADFVGMEDLASDIKNGIIDFDVVIASPDTMRVVSQLGQILGPRGLMPNPKTGTVTLNIAQAIKNAKMGQIRYRTDKNGIIHGAIGKLNFSESQIEQNIISLVHDLKKLKPVSVKGVYIKKITLSTTMGPGLSIDISNFD